jgi:hypothetical protein
MAQITRLARRELESRHEAERLLDRQKPGQKRVPVFSADPVRLGEIDRLGKSKRTRNRPSECGQVRRQTDRSAQIDRQRAYVRAFSAPDGHPGVRQTSSGRLENLDLEQVDPDTPGLALDLLTGSRSLVEPSPSHADGGVHGRNLLGLSQKLRQRGRQRLRREPTWIGLLQNAPFGVARLGRDPEGDGRLVGLVLASQEVLEFHCLIYAYRKYARGERVEGAGVARLVGPQEPANPLDHVETRQAERLVDHQDARVLTFARWTGGHRYFHPSLSFTSLSSLSILSPSAMLSS